MTAPPAPLTGLRAIALFKAGKALLLGLLPGLWLCTMIHQDVRAVAESMTASLHLHADWSFTHYLIEKASTITEANIRLVIWLLFGYAFVHGAEAAGLWRGRLWAEWFTFSSGAIYITPEIISIAHGPTWLNLGALTVSLTITAYVGWLIYHSRKRRRAARLGP